MAERYKIHDYGVLTAGGEDASYGASGYAMVLLVVGGIDCLVEGFDGVEYGVQAGDICAGDGYLDESEGDGGAESRVWGDGFRGRHGTLWVVVVCGYENWMVEMEMIFGSGCRVGFRIG